MFWDVKQLKIMEAENNLRKLDQQKDAIWAKYDALRKQEKDAKSVLNYMKNEQAKGTGDFTAQKYSWLKRLFSAKARQEYHTYQIALTKMHKLESMLRILPGDLMLAVMDASKALTQANLENKIIDAQNAILAIEKTHSLADLHMSLTEALKYLEGYKIVPVLDRSDRDIIEHPLDYQEKNDLIWVHETDIMPKQSEDNYSHVATPHQAGTEITKKITINGNDYRYSYADDTKTLFGSLNGKLEFDPQRDDPQKQRYVVLQPLAGIPNDRIGSLRPSNTYIKGKMFGDSGLDLTRDAWILCPKDELETVKKLNNKVHVIGYQPDVINGLPERGVVNAFISQLGYRVESIGDETQGWRDETFSFENNRQLKALADKENLPVCAYGSHDAIEDVCMNNTNQRIALMKTLVNQKVIKSVKDYQSIKPQIDHQIHSDYYLQRRPNNLNFIIGAMSRAGLEVTKEERNDLQNQVSNENSLDAREARENATVDEFVNKVILDNALRAHSKETERVL